MGDNKQVSGEKEQYLESMIDEIEDFIEESKVSRLNPGKVVLEKDILLTMLNELRKLVPAEMERSQKILQTKQNILNEAHEKADAIIKSAMREASATVEEHEIMQLAKRRAEEITRNAEEYDRGLRKRAQVESRKIQIGAIEYASQVTDGVETYMKNWRDAQVEAYETYMNRLEEEIDEVSQDASKLRMQLDGLTRHTRTRATEEVRAEEQEENN